MFNLDFGWGRFKAAIKFATKDNNTGCCATPGGRNVSIVWRFLLMITVPCMCFILFCWLLEADIKDDYGGYPPGLQAIGWTLLAISLFLTPLTCIGPLQQPKHSTLPKMNEDGSFEDVDSPQSPKKQKELAAASLPPPSEGAPPPYNMERGDAEQGTQLSRAGSDYPGSPQLLYPRHEPSEVVSDDEYDDYSGSGLGVRRWQRRASSPGHARRRTQSGHVHVDSSVGTQSTNPLHMVFPQSGRPAYVS